MSMSVKNIGRTGQTNFKEHNNNISAGLTGLGRTGQTNSKEHNNNISAGLKDRKGLGRTGQINTEEHNNAISAGLKIYHAQAGLKRITHRAKGVRVSAKSAKCATKHCTNQTVLGGFCFAHGAREYMCNTIGCRRKMHKGGFCSAHGAARM